MKPFEAGPEGYVAYLEPAESRVLARLADDVAAMVRSELDPDDQQGWVPEGWNRRVAREGSADPAVRRLLPAASSDDQVAEEFRRLAASDIADRKIAGLGLLAGALRSGPRVVVTREQADPVAGALTDIRLVLAERLHLRSDGDVEAVYEELSGTRRRARRGGDEGARRHLIAVFLIAGLLQETLVEGMLADLRAGRRG